MERLRMAFKNSESTCELAASAQMRVNTTVASSYSSYSQVVIQS